MEKNSTGSPGTSLFDGTAWFDSIETGVRDRIRGFIETMFEEELTMALGRGRYRRGGDATVGYRHGTRIGKSSARSARSRSLCRGGGHQSPRVGLRNGAVRHCPAMRG